MDYLEGAIPYGSETIDEYTRKGWWLDMTFGDVLDRAVDHDPDKVAVIDGQTSLTYRELKEKVDRFAREASN